MTRYIFVTGGVVSGLGKGITASSIALLLKLRGYKVFMQKFDPYINVNMNNMSPLQHGEVYVTKDGALTDLDLGHYERFIDEELNYSSNYTTGKIFRSVLEKEQKGDYLGATLQFVPHVTNEIKSKIFEAGISSDADFVITEIGGTIGDIESEMYIETLRQLRNDLGKERILFVHTTLIPYVFGSFELKTKPTQHSVIELRSLGIEPDILVCRTPNNLDNDIKNKLSLYCSINKNNIIEAIDAKNIYQIPINFYKQKIDEAILNQFKLELKESNIKPWQDFADKVETIKDEIEISLVGKYTELHDAYISVVESLKHAGYYYNKNIKINWVDCEKIEDMEELFKNSKGIIIPSAPGTRGIEGIIKTIKYARENNIPTLVLGLSIHHMITEIGKNVCNLSEFELNEIIIENNQRLGNYDIGLLKNSKVYNLYNDSLITERHRNNYEFNNKYKKILEKNNIIFSGVNEKLNLVEIIEHKNHPFFIGCLFHPEFKSRPIKPHPLFKGFIDKCKD